MKDILLKYGKKTVKIIRSSLLFSWLMQQRNESIYNSGPGCSKVAKLNPGLAETFVSCFQLFDESFYSLFLFFKNNFFLCKVLPNISVE